MARDGEDAHEPRFVHVAVQLHRAHRPVEHERALKRGALGVHSACVRAVTLALEDRDGAVAAADDEAVAVVGPAADEHVHAVAPHHRRRVQHLVLHVDGREVGGAAPGEEVRGVGREGEGGEVAHLVAEGAVLGGERARRWVEDPVCQLPLAARRQLEGGGQPPLCVERAPAPARAKRHVGDFVSRDDAAAVHVPHDELFVLAHREQEPPAMREVAECDAYIVLLKPVFLCALGQAAIDALRVLPDNDVGLLAVLAGREEAAVLRQVDARHLVIVPTQEDLVVRVLQLRDHNASAEDVDDRRAVGMHVQRVRRLRVEADGVFEIHWRGWSTPGSGAAAVKTHRL